MDPEPILCLVGPTASGKSALALEVAQRLGAEIVSLDSMQVYRRMDVGTAKPSAGERGRVAHHMLDRAEPSELYDVHRYLSELEPVLADLAARGRRALFVGGTGFWLASLLRGLLEGPAVDRALRAAIERRVLDTGAAAAHAELARADPRSAARIHPNDTKRLVRALEVLEASGRPLSEWQREWGWHGERAPERPHRALVLELDAAELDARIARRARTMLDAGWVEEALAVEAGGGYSATSIQALGYREVLDLGHGRTTRAACEATVALRTRQFARRQRTWYRKLAGAARLAAAPEEGPTPALAEAALRALGREPAG